MPRLGVNIDHVATLRQARGGQEPDPVWAASIAELAGAGGITVHLREDRRHIQERDLRLLREIVSTRLNLEMACEPAIVAIAVATRPDCVTLVPEKRAELTTEGGLDAVGQQGRVADVVGRLREAGIEVSLFLDPEERQVDVAVEVGADAVELHTGRYAEAGRGPARGVELEALASAGAMIRSNGLALHAGHGLNYENVGAVAAIQGMVELNIGHSLISRAVFVGLDRAVREMREAIDRGLGLR